MGYGFLVADWRCAFWESLTEMSPIGDTLQFGDAHTRNVFIVIACGKAVS